MYNIESERYVGGEVAACEWMVAGSIELTAQARLGRTQLVASHPSSANTSTTDPASQCLFWKLKWLPACGHVREQPAALNGAYETRFHLPA